MRKDCIDWYLLQSPDWHYTTHQKEREHMSGGVTLANSCSHLKFFIWLKDCGLKHVGLVVEPFEIVHILERLTIARMAWTKHFVTKIHVQRH